VKAPNPTPEPQRLYKTRKKGPAHKTAKEHFLIGFLLVASKKTERTTGIFSLASPTAESDSHFAAKDISGNYLLNM
jgi:hypothetical protein